MISGSISPYSPLQNPASEQSERAIYLSKSVIFIIFRYLLVFLVVGKNDRDLVSNDSFFLIFYDNRNKQNVEVLGIYTLFL